MFECIFLYKLSSAQFLEGVRHRPREDADTWLDETKKSPFIERHQDFPRTAITLLKTKKIKHRKTKRGKTKK